MIIRMELSWLPGYFLETRPYAPAMLARSCSIWGNSRIMIMKKVWSFDIFFLCLLRFFFFCKPHQKPDKLLPKSPICLVLTTIYLPYHHVAPTDSIRQGKSGAIHSNSERAVSGWEIRTGYQVCGAGGGWAVGGWRVGWEDMGADKGGGRYLDPRPDNRKRGRIRLGPAVQRVGTTDGGLIQVAIDNKRCKKFLEFDIIAQRDYILRTKISSTRSS